MIGVKCFECNPFRENTYVLFNAAGECAIVDPGMYTSAEENLLVNFIREKNLTPVLLLNTHCHIDHVLGNAFVFNQYGLLPRLHREELQVLTAVPAYAPQFGLRYEVSPLPETFLPETGTIFLGGDALQLIFAPGHSPGHLCFYSEPDNFLIGGDVLFYESIGRTDLPGGNHPELIRSIRGQLFILPDACTVYPGHGPSTTIAHEKRFNPYLR